MTCEDCIYYSDIALLACPYWICKNDDKPCEHFKDKNADSEEMTNAGKTPVVWENDNDT